MVIECIKNRERLCIEEPLNFKIQDSIQVTIEKSNILQKNVGLKPYCERYAAHGYCSLATACPKSHDLDIILENLENLPRLKKQRVDKDHQEEPSKFTQVEHSACYDSYMTGYIFCNQTLKRNEVMVNSKNKLYLIGKSRPLLIEKSRFSKLSTGHLKLK